ncbi:hypothetical protein [Streptomyces anulatus]|uniref:hypothetical protein n=1 Tax=Streptomyces anulatus TaxID=1892 RepID=UPI00363DADF3
MTEQRNLGRTGFRVSPLALGTMMFGARGPSCWSTRAVTSAIIGPRTFGQVESRLGADKVKLGRDVLDRIDEIVPPGVNLSALDAGYTPAVVTDASPQRRSA